jgi:ArsR family transcriptional regulator, arsenate/arsenite/antimonite-responsive transcriptional repressor
LNLIKSIWVKALVYRLKTHFFRKLNTYFDNSKNIVDNSQIKRYDWIMEIEIAAKKLAELGHITRLSIFRYLVKVGDQGAPVGQIQEELDVPGSTLSHHISRLVSVGLIKQVRESRTLYCVPQFNILDELVEFLKSECCTEAKCKR